MVLLVCKDAVKHHVVNRGRKRLPWHSRYTVCTSVFDMFYPGPADQRLGLPSCCSARVLNTFKKMLRL